ncbi:hypothetical protein C8Q75DRAFT_769333 [Abortiporus biennis]|nr:hypothetical protein C8Q75DRAFT_769333 [Abortiporus biennis]
MSGSSYSSENSQTQVTPSDGLYNYDIHEEIGHGEHSIVYRATCRRGRLRNRQVALKKINLGDRSLNPSPLHASFHHLTIISLLSSFATPIAEYHVLELCSRSTLYDFLQAIPQHRISEAELRSISRSLVEALLYLAKQNVVHGNISPRTVLINDEYRVKLSGFKKSFKSNYLPDFDTDLKSLGRLMVMCLSGCEDLDLNTSTPALTFLPSATSSQAEDLISRLLSSHISLQGILSHPFFDSSLPVEPLKQQLYYRGIPNNNKAAKKVYPSALSKAPPTCIPLRQNSLPTARKPFGDIGNRISSTTANSKPGLRTFLSTHMSQAQPNPQVTQSLADYAHNVPPWQRRVSSAPHSLGLGLGIDIGLLGDSNLKPISRSRSTERRRSVRSTSTLDFAIEEDIMEEINDPVIRPPSSSSATSAATMTTITTMTRKITPALTVDTGSSSVSSVSGLGLRKRSGSVPGDSTTTLGSGLARKFSIHSTVPIMTQKKERGSKLEHLLLGPQPDSVPFGHPVKTTAEDDEDEDEGTIGTPTMTRASLAQATRFSSDPLASISKAQTQQYQSRHTSDLELHTKSTNDNNGIPQPPSLNTHGIIPINTSYLLPQTHKVTKGSLTILPNSLSLLIDFREGERRRIGRSASRNCKENQGKEVLVVGCDGEKIEVYSAPHLSSPCCLIEPFAVYTLQTLPNAYVKQYEDARKIVEHLKRKVPKMILYKPQAKCTLFANEPFGDIEIVLSHLSSNFLPSSSSSSSQLQSLPSNTDSSSNTDTSTSSSSGSIRLRLVGDFDSSTTGYRLERGTLEISRLPSSSSSHGSSSGIVGEWSKKVFRVDFPLSNAGEVTLKLSKDDSTRLDKDEQLGVTVVEEFLHVCERVDSRQNSSNLNTEGRSLQRIPTPIPRFTDDHTLREQDVENRMNSEAISLMTAATPGTSLVQISGILDQCHVPPRPPKFSSFPSSSSNTGMGTGFHQAQVGNDSESPNNGKWQDTKFIPSVGWCLWSSQGEERQGDQYRIMFLDGALLYVDMELGVVELSYTNGQDSEVKRYSDGSWAGSSADEDVKERMMIFGKVVSNL